MKEREKILDLWRELREQGTRAVLVTVVKTLGSSYRRPGARLLITETGRRAGSISGGCLEDEVVKKAWWLSENGSVVRRYDTTPDGDIAPGGEASGGFGLGCNGIIYLLFQRVSGSDIQSPLVVLEDVYLNRKKALLAHILEPSKSVATLAADQIPESLRQQTEAVTTSVVARLPSGEEVFFETLVPPVRLLIFGAGDDAVPLTDLARHLGWQVCVFDGRAHYARADKFPSAQRVAVRDPTLDLKDLQIDSRTVAMVMTHSYSQDLNFLKALATEPLAYVGILGPRNRSEQLIRDAALLPSDLPAVHGPAGLDIGADGPEQVALSIIAEIQAVLNGRDGGPLRQRRGSIHSTESDSGGPHRFVPGIVCA